MKHITLYITAAILNLGIGVAQSRIPQILLDVENNNLTLKSAQQRNKVEKISAKTGIYLPNPTVEYDHLFGNAATDNNKLNELKIVQEFDFPTTYFQKSKIADLKSESSDVIYRSVRQTVLESAQKLCLELVYYNKQSTILNNRLENAQKLKSSYHKRLAVGDANILEVNKLELEVLNVLQQARSNELERNTRIQKLGELNGGIDILFSDTIYYHYQQLISLDDIIKKTMDFDPNLNNLEKVKQVASKEIELAKGLMLPRFALGYRIEVEKPDKYQGITAGITIPLWENKNLVKKARAELLLADLEIENERLEQITALQQLYSKVQLLQQSNEEYKRVISVQNNFYLLNKALETGQISLLQYLTETDFLYQSTESFLVSELEYQLTLAQMLKVYL